MSDSRFAVNSLESHWMPFTANREFKNDPRLLVKSEGVYSWDHKGGKVLDGSSGLFCVAAGHGRKEIANKEIPLHGKIEGKGREDMDLAMPTRALLIVAACLLLL